MERRHAPIRSTVSCDQNETLDDDESFASANSTWAIGKNTNKLMYGKNPLYQILCIYCNEKFSGSVVQHYVKNHLDYEVPISRLSPSMAKRLKSQIEFHQNGKKKITGLCYFCEENQSFSSMEQLRMFLNQKKMVHWLDSCATNVTISNFRTTGSSII